MTQIRKGSCKSPFLTHKDVARCTALRQARVVCTGGRPLANPSRRQIRQHESDPYLLELWMERTPSVCGMKKMQENERVVRRCERLRPIGIEVGSIYLTWRADIIDLQKT